ncbi:hypothetical protein CL644_02390 [bacterium]|nr:hypothetical protein [bacterium]|tara:strand:+ start:4402 stop:7422 length:3021 start_codon:yes stop_codon:yes gene_type:complete
MENRRPVTLAVLVVSFFAFAIVDVGRVHAYAVSAHSVLTEALLQEYEEKQGDVFSSEEEAAIVRGSREEDDDARYLNHFYDPVSKKGVAKNKSSVEWMNDIIKQANWGVGKLGINRLKATEPLFSGVQDYTWKRAVYEYAHGDAVRGAEALGHVLHLIQDATVPAHVRNDPHLSRWGIGDEDRYEDFSENFILSDVPPFSGSAKYFTNLDEAVMSTALFTQENFLSEDTLFKDYDLPKRAGLRLEMSKVDGVDQYFGIGKYGEIVRVDKEKNWVTNERVEKYFLTDKQDKILTENWEALSHHAISSGMGIIDLFFREVEQEKQSKELLSMNKSRTDTKRFVKSLAFVRDSQQGMIASLSAADVYELNKDDLDGYFAAAEIYNIPVPVVARESVLKDEPNTQPASALLGLRQAGQPIIGERIPAGTPPAPEREVDERVEVELELPTKGEQEEEIVDVVLTEEAPPEMSVETSPMPEVSSSNSSPFEPGGYGYGGGGSGVSNEETTTVTVEPPVVASPENNTFVATTTVSFFGTGVTDYVVTGIIATTTATTTVASDGTWTIDPGVLSEGIIEASFTQSDIAGNTSSANELRVEVDVTNPNPTVLEVLECTATLRNDGMCLAGTTEVHLSWVTVPDAATYSVLVNDSIATTTTATTTTIHLEDQQTSNVVVNVIDAAGNSASSNTVSVEVFANPIVISEIAWGGTAASIEDEWFELYNRTDYELTLANIHIRRESGIPPIALSGTISTGSSWNTRTYIVERGDGTATTKVEDLATNFNQFSDDGEELTLEISNSDFSSVLDSTPSVSICSGWCGGTNSGKFYSMERKDVAIAGNEGANWQSNDGYDVVNEFYDSRGYEYGTDRKIYGTVGQENSKGYPEVGYFCAPYTDSFQEGGIYSPDVPANLSTPNCTYLNKLWGAEGYAGSAYRGVVGSSTLLAGHSVAGIKSNENGDITDALEDGDNIFIAFWKRYTGAAHDTDDQEFFDYMIGQGTTTPHSDFRVLNWVYSE